MTAPTTVEREAVKVVCDVLQAELGLDDKHCLLSDQEYDIPADEQLFAVIFDSRSKPVGAANALDTDPASPTVGQEIQQSAVFHEIIVALMSFNGDARARKEEVGLALQSSTARMLGEKWGVTIYRPSEPIDATDAEGGSRLRRYDTHVKVSQLHQKVKAPGAGVFTKFNVPSGEFADGTINPPSITTEP